MDFDKRTIFAFVLIGLILILINTGFYQKIVDPKGYEQRQLQRTQRVEQGAVEPRGPAIQPRESSPAIENSDQDFSPVKKTPGIEVPDSLGEKKITIQTSLYKATMTSKGATILQWSLLNYLGTDKEPVELFTENSYNNLVVGFNTKAGDSLTTGDYHFMVDSPEEIKLSAQQEFVLKFTLPLGENREIEKIYTFRDGTYDVSLLINFKNLNQLIDDKQYYLLAPNGLASTEKNMKDEMTYTKAGTSAGGETKKDYKADDKAKKVAADLDWVAVRNKYFAFYILPRNRNSQYAEILGTQIAQNRTDKVKWKKYSLKLAMPFLGESNVKDEYTLFIGPMEYGLLKSYKKDMQDFLDMGAKIIKPFSIAILITFKWMHTFISNYGVILLIFSLLIKVLTYPLTLKSYESMQKMQTLQPKLKELQDKYRSDPQKLNQMTMTLYKEQGVNPMGGCLPMLLQMPLLFGLFIVFRTTIDLRGQGFIWWINDLSAPDTIFTFPGNFALPIYGNTVNILPILMGVTMFIQQKMSITDPKQKFMIYFMPIFFTLLFNSFPSGLNLYYALFNILSIVQQKYLTPKKPETALATTSKRKRRI